jgi:hypothetical protein
MKKTMLAIFGLCVGAMVCLAANEINTIITFKATKGSLDITRAVNLSFTLNAAQPQAAGLTQVFTTNPTAITIGNVGTNGWGYFRNLSTNTYIELGYYDTTNFAAIVRMNTNEPALFRVAQGVTIYGRASTNSVTLEKLILDN